MSDLSSQTPAMSMAPPEGVERRDGVMGVPSVTVRPDLVARLGVAARLVRSATDRSAEGLAARELHTRRLKLRTLRAGDQEEFHRVLRLSKGHLWEFCPLGYRDEHGLWEEREDHVFRHQLTLSRGALGTGRACRLAAFDADGRLVGAFNINDISRGLEHTGELVFWVSADAQRRGYAEEGLRAVMAHAFADLPEGLGLHRLVAMVAPANEACRRLARKVGLELSVRTPPVELVLGERRVMHEVYEAFASIGGGAPDATILHNHVVEGKPSIAENVFGRGLMTILGTEAAARSHARLDPTDDPTGAPPGTATGG
jgi:RimJ/RimL family protein N-acetyltransferase